MPRDEANRLNLYGDVVAAGLCPRMAVDLACVAEGIRDHILLHFSYDDAPSVTAIVDSLGLSIEAQRDLQKRSDPGTQEVLLSDHRGGGDPEDLVREIWVCRAGDEVDPSTLFGAPGAMLGYPECCIERYESCDGLSAHYEEYLFGDEPRHWELNRLAFFFREFLPIPDYFPCSLACDASRDFLRPILDLSQEIMPPEVFKELTGAMQAPLLVAGGELMLLLDWQQDGETLSAQASAGEARSLESISKENSAKAGTSPFVIPFDHFKEAGELHLLGSAGDIAVVPVGRPRL